MQFGTNYDDTLNLLYLELLRFSVKFGKRWSGPNFEIRLGFLFLRFCGNLKSQGKMLL